MDQQRIIALPQFAPLSVPMVLHLLHMSQEGFLRQMDSSIIELLDHLEALLRSVQEIRRDVFEQVKLVQKPHEKGFDYTAAMMIISAMDRREFRHAHEPYRWWCYSQPAPGRHSLPVPRPIPVLDDCSMKPGTLLWTSWPSFDSAWHQMSSFGAACLWKLDQDPECLVRWDSSLLGNKVLVQCLQERNKRVVQSLAQSLLAKLSLGRIGADPALPDWPFLWDEQMIVSHQ